MCNFVSWIEYKNEILFLTDDDLLMPKGKELVKYLGSKYWDDIMGHGAIRHFHNLKQEQGIDKERTDLSNPNLLPKEVVEAIKKCQFKSIGLSESLLTPEAWAKYEKIQQPALAKYQKIEQTALAKYEKIQQPAWAKYEKIQQPALAEYQKIQQPAWAKYEKIQQPALAEYQKICHKKFWELFSKPENRIKAWR